MELAKSHNYHFPCQLTKESVVFTSCPSKVYVAADNAVAIVTTGLNLGAVSCVSVAGGHEQVWQGQQYQLREDGGEPEDSQGQVRLYTGYVSWRRAVCMYETVRVRTNTQHAKWSATQKLY